MLVVPAPLGAAEPTLPIPVLVCQQTIGNEARRFVTRVHGAERRCGDDRARGLACDAARRDDAVATAQLKLGRLYAARCGAIALGDLGFPARCDDPDGAPFTVGELHACVDGSHRAGVATAIAAAYPESGAPLAGAALACQRALGVAAERFLAQRLRARQSCRNDQLSGAVAAAVACDAEAPPAGPGTGHRPTDRRLAVAAERLATQLARRCETVALAELGFPGACSDPDGPPFSLADLSTCLRDGHRAVADALFALEYPAIP